MHKKCSRDLHTHHKKNNKKNPKCFFFFFFFFFRPNSNKIGATGPYLECIPKNWRTGWSNQGSSARESRRYGHSSYNKIAQHHAWSFNKTHSKTITGLNRLFAGSSCSHHGRLHLKRDASVTNWDEWTSDCVTTFVYISVPIYLSR